MGGKNTVVSAVLKGVKHLKKVLQRLHTAYAVRDGSCHEEWMVHARRKAGGEITLRRVEALCP